MRVMFTLLAHMLDPDVVAGQGERSTEDSTEEPQDAGDDTSERAGMD